MRARAAIDIGSNSLLLTVVAENGDVLHDEARVVGLGRGLGDRGLFAPDRMEAAGRVLADYMRIAQQHGIEPWEVRAVATSAARRAMNADTWIERIQRKLSLRIRVISGDEEARLTWLGAMHDLPRLTGTVLVVDLGGGSTELVLGEITASGSRRVLHRQSLELGSARLTESFLGFGTPDPKGLARLRNHVEVELRSLGFSLAPRTVIGVAGTVTTLAATRMGLSRYDGALVHGSRLTRADLAGFIDRLLPCGPEQRRALIPVAPDRADFLLAGATVLDRVLGLARRQQMIVSDRGLRYGLVSGGLL